MQEVEIIRAKEFLHRFGVQTITDDGNYRCPFEVMQDIAKMLRRQRTCMTEHQFAVFYTAIMTAILGLEYCNEFCFGGNK